MFQYLLDCSYVSSGKDGCLGGWYSDCFRLLANTQHVVAMADYPYENRCALIIFSIIALRTLLNRQVHVRLNMIFPRDC